MRAILARAFSQAARAEVDTEEVKVIATFCGTGLLLSLLAAMAFGLKLGAELF